MTRERTAHLIFASNKDNSYKFYRLTLDANGVVSKNWGRVGAAGQSQTESTGDHGFERILNEKRRKGYVEVDIIAADTVAVSTTNDHAALTVAARTGLIVKPVGRGSVKARAALDTLIERLVAANAHDILQTSGGYIKVDTSGIIQTPMGIVSSRALHEAGRILNAMRGEPVGPRLTSLIEQYLRVVPQRVSAKRGWAETFFDKDNTIDTQLDLVDKLSGAVSFAATAKAAAIAAATKASKNTDASVYADLFRIKVSLLTDRKEFDRIHHKYASTRNRNHSGYNLEVKKVFVLTDTDEANSAFDKRAVEIGNVQELFHGSPASNMLSILRKGLFIPPKRGSNIRIAGRMFGNGVYHSSLGTKSAQYSNAAGLRDHDSSRFLLVNDVAMGSEYRPVGGYSEAEYLKPNRFGRPFNSVNVKAGTGGVLNHEAVVRHLDQIKMRYLVELG
jgi:poly [ADP-ribose] polymerase